MKLEVSIFLLRALWYICDAICVAFLVLRSRGVSESDAAG